MSRCMRCGAPFHCGMVEGSDEPCWCTRLPKVPAQDLPTPADGEAASCLCPACLKSFTDSFASPGANSPA